MKRLYTENAVIGKLLEQISTLFSDEVQSIQNHLYHLLLSMLALDGFRSVKFSFEHFIESISTHHLKSYYYTLNESRIDLESWTKHLIQMVLSIIPKALRKQAIILSINDTMAKKSGKTNRKKRISSRMRRPGCIG